MKRIFILYVLLFLVSLTGSLMQSCCEDTVCTTISEITLTPKDNGGKELQDYNGAVYAKALILVMDVGKDEDYYCSKPFSFFNKAYATSCSHIYKSDPIVSWDIVADRRFDDTHDAGARLYDLFRIEGASSVYDGSYNSSVNFYLLNNPTDTGAYVFTVRLQLESGKVFEKSTEPIILLK